MKNIQIWDLLKDFENQIEYQKTPILRADTLLKLLQVEHSNAEEINLLRGAQLGLNEMFAEMNKVDKEFEIRLAIQILTYYLDTNSFGLLATPINGPDISNVEKFESIKTRLKEIVEKHDTNADSFLDQ